MVRRKFLKGSAAMAASGAMWAQGPAGKNSPASPLVVFAEFFAKPGKENELRQAVLGLIGPTRKQKGCIQYDLHSDNENPGHFFFYEKWASKEDLDAHAASAPLTAFGAKSEALLAQPRRLVLAKSIG
jgi:quinol monooxygenase YgiN